MNPQTEAQALGNRIGTQLQQAALPDRMKVWEALDLYASFYKRTVPWEPLLEQWGLAGKRDTQFGNLSGGQKQRLFISLALLNQSRNRLPRRADHGAGPTGAPRYLGFSCVPSVIRAKRSSSSPIIWMRSKRLPAAWRSSITAVSWLQTPGQSHCRPERRNPGALHRSQWFSVAAVKRDSRRCGRRSTAAAGHRPRLWPSLGQGRRCPRPGQHRPRRSPCHAGRSGRCLSLLNRASPQGLIAHC